MAWASWLKVRQMVLDGVRVFNKSMLNPVAGQKYWYEGPGLPVAESRKRPYTKVFKTDRDEYPAARMRASHPR